MQLSHVKHFPHALRDVAASVEYAPAKFGDFTTYAVVEDEGSQAAAEESELGYARRRQGSPYLTGVPASALLIDPVSASTGRYDW
jgi:hypothetical protein